MAGGVASRTSIPITNYTRPTRPPQATLARNIALALLALLVLAGLVALITWLVIRPTKLLFSIDKASIRDYNLTSSKLNSTFDFTIRVYNPNHKVSVYYDNMQVSASYQDQVMATRVMGPFFRGHKNVTQIGPEVVAHNVGIGGSREQALKRERIGGAVKLDVEVKGRIRFRVGMWKSGHYKLKVRCNLWWFFGS